MTTIVPTPPLSFGDLQENARDKRSRVPLIVIGDRGQPQRDSHRSTLDLTVLKPWVRKLTPRHPFIAEEIPLDPSAEWARSLTIWRVMLHGVSTPGVVAVAPHTAALMDDADWEELRAVTAGGPVVAPPLHLVAIRDASRRFEDKSRHTRNSLRPALLQAVQQPGSNEPAWLTDSEPQRGFEQARREAKRLLTAGWSRREIIDYLTLFGYRNDTGIAGSWDRTDRRAPLFKGVTP